MLLRNDKILLVMLVLMYCTTINKLIAIIGNCSTYRAYYHKQGGQNILLHSAIPFFVSVKAYGPALDLNLKKDDGR
jgi:hypothetical protein